ncbi:MAG: hypothetical protein ACI4J0_01100 [Huintestinicola sp.]|uniref:hypothetical protein n=1 Tax=Huintestinicola sp. TaxID=2981661 RepID=UPI003F0278F8
MTAFDLFTAIGGVSEKTLAETERAVPAKNVWLRPAVTAAACLILCIAAVSIMQREQSETIPEVSEQETSYETFFSESEAMTPSEAETEVPTSEDITENETAPSEMASSIAMQNPPTMTEQVLETETAPSQTETSFTDSDTPETAIVPKWEDMTDLERYIYLSYNGSDYSITTEHFDESELSFLGNGEIYGLFDELSVEDWEEGAKKTVPCGFYRINGISPEYIIAVPTSDGYYTGYVNHDFCGRDMGDFIKSTDFFTRNPFTVLYSGEKCDGLDYYEYSLPDLIAVTDSILLSDKSVKAETNPPANSGAILYVVQSGDKAVFYVYEGGYVRIGQKFFFVGKDKCAAFDSYVRENAESAFVSCERRDDTEIIPE